MKKQFKKLKSNKGFTMQDIIIAMAILVLFAGTIGGIYVAVYKIQCETKLNAVATLYAIQILENIDKISYDEVTTGMESNYRSLYNVPDSMNLQLDVSQYGTDDVIKIIKLTISYESSGDTEEIVLEKIKVREI